jgi:hypothetical protein
MLCLLCSSDVDAAFLRAWLQSAGTVQDVVITPGAGTEALAEWNAENWVRTRADSLRAVAAPLTSRGGTSCVSWSEAVDDFTLFGPAGTSITATVNLDVDYDITDLGGSVFIGRIITELSAKSIAVSDSRLEERHASTPPGGQVTGDENVDLSVTFNWTVGEVVGIRSFMSASGTRSALVDAGDTAVISLDLPAGYSATSVMGFNSAPEPTGILLVAPLAACAVLRRQ